MIFDPQRDLSADFALIAVLRFVAHDQRREALSGGDDVRKGPFLTQTGIDALESVVLCAHGPQGREDPRDDRLGVPHEAMRRRR